jgi:DNA-binding phage protein
MTRDEDLPPEVREAIAEGITRIESDARLADSRLFWPRLISRLAYKELKRVANPAINSLMKVVSEAGGKVGLNAGSAS